jgi:hypothetical protein
MAAKYGPKVLICMPNRTECILFVSVAAQFQQGVAGISSNCTSMHSLEQHPMCGYHIGSKVPILQAR